MAGSTLQMRFWLAFFADQKIVKNLTPAQNHKIRKSTALLRPKGRVLGAFDDILALIFDAFSRSTETSLIVTSIERQLGSRHSRPHQKSIQ